MARRGVLGPPYATALHLTAWAVTNSSYVNAKLRTLAVRVDDLDLAELYDVIHMLWVEGAHLPHKELREALEQPFWIERATWGQGPVSEASHRAMMALSGGPAPRRDPAQQRPRPIGQVTPEPAEEATA